MIKTALVKISGDLVARPDVMEWIKRLSTKRFVVICVGGGSRINKEFKRRGFEIDFGPLGRRTKTFKEKQLARDILEQNQACVQDLLAENRIKAVVVIPVLDIGSVLCHVNGDVFVRAAYLGFDDLYVLTHESRQAAKARAFEDLRRVKVVGFSELV